MRLGLTPTGAPRRPPGERGAQHLRRKVAGWGAGESGRAGVGAGGGAVVLHEAVTVPSSEAAARARPAPPAPGVLAGTGHPRPGAWRLPPGRMEGAGRLHRFFLGLSAHRLQSA